MLMTLPNERADEITRIQIFISSARRSAAI